MEMNFEALYERLSRQDGRAALVNYILNAQGFELRRLDYKLAASALGKSEKTVGRYVSQLADMKLIILHGDSLKLNQDVLQSL